MDGVIVDTEGVHLEAFRLLLDEYAIPYSKDFLTTLIGYSIKHNITTIKRRYNDLLTLPTDRAIQKRNDIYLALIAGRTLQPLPGVLNLVKRCQASDVKLALASSSERRQVTAVMKKTIPHYTEVFEAIVSGSDVEKMKPAPDIYLAALEKLDVPAAAAIAVEDSPAGVSSAKSAGIYCYALRNNYITEEKLSAADSIVHSLQEIRLN